MKKVLQVVPYLHPNAGGPPVVVLQYSARLPAYGYASPILTTDAYSPGGAAEVFCRYGDARDLTVLPDGAGVAGALSRANRREVRDAVAAADLLHVHCLWHVTGAWAIHCARQLSKRYVVSPHGMLDPYSMSIGAIKKRVYWKLIESRNCADSACVVFTTEEERRLARATLGSGARTSVVVLGADDPPLLSKNELKTQGLKAHPMLSGKRVILFLGRLHPKKGVDLCVRVFAEVLARVPDACLLIVGEGDAAYEHAVREEIESLGLREAVFLVGFLEGQDKWTAIACADLFILPSYQENFGLAAAEAAKLGVPLLISSEVNLSSYVVSFNAGVVVPRNDTAKWVDEAVQILTNDVRRAEMGANALSMSNSMFKWEKSTEALASVYNGVLQSSD